MAHGINLGCVFKKKSKEEKKINWEGERDPDKTFKSRGEGPKRHPGGPGSIDFEKTRGQIVLGVLWNGRRRGSQNLLALFVASPPKGKAQFEEYT